MALTSSVGSFDARIEQEWRLAIEFSSWVSRIGTSAEGIAAIRTLWSSAPFEVRDYFKLQNDLSFELDAGMLTSAAQHVVAGQVEEMVKQFRAAEQKQLGYSNLRDSDVLKALVFLLRLAQGRTSGRPKSRAFIDFLYDQFPEKESAVLAAQEAGTPAHRAVG